MWYGRNNLMNKAYHVPGNKQTNQVAELYAILRATKEAPMEAPLLIKSDSKYAVNALTKYHRAWEDRGWIDVDNGELIKTIVAWMRIRNSTTSFQWVEGHNGEEGNEGADKLAAEGALQPQSCILDLTVPKDTTYTGAKLSELSQGDIYMGIKQQETPGTRQRTKSMLDIVRWAVKDLINVLPTDKNIWRSLLNKDLTRPIQSFMWNMHDAHRIGKYWDNIPDFEHCSLCPICNVEESMEHILLECDSAGPKVVWSLAKDLLERKQMAWLHIRYGTILECCVSRKMEQHSKGGTDRLFRIVITKLAHLIWKLRCER
jgi:ribonuclease HI